MNKEEFILELSKLNINIKESTIEKLITYYHLLIEENKKYNLTTITEESDVYLKHFYDSLTITKIISLTNQYILDIGSGAGFPGLVLKIVFPNIKIDLLDSTNKKCLFLQKVIDTLELKDINVINDRAEEYAKDHREQYDIITSRAVAPLKHLLEYSIPMLKVNGSFISLKGDIKEELKGINTYYQKLFLTNESIITFNLPHNKGFRTKTKKTPTLYPRTYAQIKKKEL